MTEVVEANVLVAGRLKGGVEAAAQGAVLDVLAGRADEDEVLLPGPAVRRLSWSSAAATWSIIGTLRTRPDFGASSVRIT